MIDIYYKILFGLIVLISLIRLLFPRFWAKWDFHYKDHMTPSAEYLLKTRISGGIVLVIIVVIAVVVFI